MGEIMIRMLKNSAWKIGLAFASIAGPLSAQEAYWDELDCCPAPCQSSWWDWERLSFSAEGLYWIANEDHLSPGDNSLTSFSNISVNPRLNISNSTDIEHRYELKWKYDVGYRLGLGYDLPCNDLNLDLVYTRYTNHLSSSHEAPNQQIQVGNTFFAEFVEVDQPGFSVFTANRVTTKWNLEFNDLQLDLTKKLFLKNWLAISPFIGIKFLEIKQKYDVRSIAVDDPNQAEEINVFGDASNNITTRYAAVGLQGGFNTFLSIGCGFTAYTQVSGGIVYGKATDKSKRPAVNIRRTPAVGTDAFQFTNNDIKLKSKIWTARPNFDLALGLAWDYLLCNCYSIRVKTGWEYHYYFNQNFIYLTETNNPRGNLSLMGWTFGADISF